MYFCRRISLLPRISSDFRCSRSTYASCCDTKTPVTKVEFKWTIENFDFYEAKGTSLNSSTFSAYNNKYEWFLRCCPNGSTEKKDTVSLYLHLNTVITRSVLVEATFSWCDDYGVPDSRSNTKCVYEFKPNSMYQSYATFLRKDDRCKHHLLSHKNEVMLRCYLRFSEMINFDNTLNQPDDKILECNLSNTLNPPDHKILECNLSDDLAVLLEKKEFSDVILSANGKDYEAHRNILAARSPVFAAMFRNMTEVKKYRVVCGGVNEEVLGELLRYIYTGKCQNVEQFAEELLLVADEYGLDRLKVICEEELCKKLSVENAIDILKTAKRYRAEKLKNVAIKVIVAKFSEVVKTSAWKDLIILYPRLAGEVCEAFGGH